MDSGDITKAAASREYNISPSLIDRWCQQFHEGKMRSRPTARERQLERELDRYKETTKNLKKN